MSVLDAHVHLYPPEADLDPAGWAERVGERHWATLCTRRRRDGRCVQSLPTLEDLLGAMDAAGVERAVLLGWYWEQPSTCEWQNRFYASCVRAHPDRLSAFATVHVGAGREQALAVARRAREEGFIGLGELSPHSQGVPASDPVFGELLALAGELRLPVNIHVTDPASRPFAGRIETPAADLVALARVYPQTAFIWAHWGGMIPIAHVDLPPLPNVYFDTAASPLMYDAGIWRRVLPLFPPERVLFGSDYPLNLYPKIDVVPGLDRFVAEARAGGADDFVLRVNAARLLGL